MSGIQNHGVVPHSLGWQTDENASTARSRASAHLHAATSIGTSYSASYQAAYDAVGEMICRAPTSATNCAVPSGALLSYDNEGRLSHWQNAPSSPTTTDDFLYDGAGNRVEQLATISGSPVTTIYVAGGLEEVTTSGITTTLTKYFSVAGLPTIERVGTNGPLSYLASDGQGSVSETLDGAGTVTFQQLYTPYGVSRYSNGSSPTSLGYTGQRADSSTELDYYHARYYDPAAGQFTSADTVNDGLNRYGYVHGNPATYTDPSGHMTDCKNGGDCGPHLSPPPTTTTTTTTPPPTGCHSDGSCGCYSNCGHGDKGSGNGAQCRGTINCSPTVTNPATGGCHADKSLCDFCKGDGRCAAREIASDTAWVMGTIAGAVTGVIAILSTIQRALSSVGNEAVAGVIADVIGLLYTILANATFLATAFTWEANQDLSFFAHGENIEMFGDVVLWTMVVVDTLIAGVIGWITIQSENPLVYLFGWADAVVLLSSAAALGLVAEDSLNRQENAIGYGATFT